MSNSPPPPAALVAWERADAQIGAVPTLDEADLLARASAAADLRWPGARVVGLRPLHGGVSSLTFASTIEVPGGPTRPTVLKVAPPGMPPVLHRDVLRQARLLEKLSLVAGLAVPAIYLECEGDPPFFAMEFAPGDCFEPRTDVLVDPPEPAVVTARAHAAATMLGRMQTLTLGQLGLTHEPVVALSDEVERWGRLLSTVDADIAPGHREVHQRLLASVPAPLAPTLQHGDYRLGNMIFERDRLNALIDWEIWSVGDPRIDLAWLLMHTDPVHRFRRQDAANQRAASGMPSPGELLRTYHDVRPVDVPDLDWFAAYCYYKVVATVSVFVKRNRRKAEPDPVITTVGQSLHAVLARAENALTTVESRGN